MKIKKYYLWIGILVISLCGCSVSDRIEPNITIYPKNYTWYFYTPFTKIKTIKRELQVFIKSYRPYIFTQMIKLSAHSEQGIKISKLVKLYLIKHGVNSENIYERYDNTGTTDYVNITITHYKVEQSLCRPDSVVLWGSEPLSDNINGGCFTKYNRWVSMERPEKNISH